MRLNLTEHDPAFIKPDDLLDLYRDLHSLEDLFTQLIPRSYDEE